MLLVLLCALCRALFDLPDRCDGGTRRLAGGAASAYGAHQLRNPGVTLLVVSVGGEIGRRLESLACRPHQLPQPLLSFASSRG